jgi:hypothetical protein
MARSMARSIRRGIVAFTGGKYRRTPMITSSDAQTLAADLSRMASKPIPLERAEEILGDQMPWLPEGEPQQCVAEDVGWDVPTSAGVYRMHRRTILTRLPDEQLGILVEVALTRPDGIELERREFEAPTGEADAYVTSLRERLTGKP